MQLEARRMSFLIRLLHHRWAAEILGEVARGGGARFVELQHSLSVSPTSLRASLDALLALDLVRRNPGYGHPLRPEYIATPRGAVLAPPVVELLKGLRALGVEETALRKWSLPVLVAVVQGAGRFGEIGSAVEGITPRALAIALKDLAGSDLILREIEDGYPPVPRYAATRDGKRIGRLLGRVGSAAARTRKGG